MARSKAQGRKGKQKNKLPGAKAKKKAGNDNVVTTNGTQARQPNDGMSRRERQKMNRAKREQGELPARKKVMTRSQGQPMKNEEPKSKEELDKEMDDYITTMDEKIGSTKLEEDVDSDLEQKEAEEAGEAAEGEAPWPRHSTKRSLCYRILPKRLPSSTLLLHPHYVIWFSFRSISSIVLFDIIYM